MVPTARASSPAGTSSQCPPSASHCPAISSTSRDLPAPAGPAMNRTDWAASEAAHPRSSASSAVRPVNATTLRSGRSSAAGPGSPANGSGSCPAPGAARAAFPFAPAGARSSSRCPKLQPTPHSYPYRPETASPQSASWDRQLRSAGLGDAAGRLPLQQPGGIGQADDGAGGVEDLGADEAGLAVVDDHRARAAGQLAGRVTADDLGVGGQVTGPA